MLYYLVVLQLSGKSEVKYMAKSVGNLSLIEKVGQMFIIGIDGYTADETIMELIQKYKVGGFIIYENNVKSAEQLLRLINALKTMNSGNEIPLFIAIAQEGGRINVLPSEIRKLPAIKYIAETQDKNLLYETANLTGRILDAFGFNINFWPVLDLGGEVEGRTLADRCLNNNPNLVSNYSTQLIKGLTDANIIAVPKYFPGHGTTKNSGSSIVIPSTSKSMAKLEFVDIVPFKAAMESGVDGILVGNINLARLNLFAPATMSYKVVTKLIKEKYQYDGLVIADNLTTPAVDIQYGIKSSVRKAVLAGCDLMIVKDAKKITSVLDDIAKQIRVGNLLSQEIDLRVQKILDLKTKYNLKDEEKTEIEIRKFNEEIEALIDRIRK